jgi:hypothetical protein
MADEYWKQKSSSPELSPAEEKLLFQIESAKGATGRGAATFGAAGTTLGAVAGGLIGGIGGAGIGALPGAGIGAAIGGGLGSAIGGLVGGQSAAKIPELEKKLAAIQEQKQTENLEKQARMEAFSRLLGKYGRMG